MFMTETQSFITDDGCSIAYRLDGDPGAPVLLLSNSLGTSMAMWEPQLAAFSGSHRVLRYDSRGHGRSNAPAGSYSMDRLGRDAVLLLDALGIERVDFCGLSKGGMVGQWLGYRHPERLRRLVLANTSAYMGPPDGWQVRIDTLMQLGMASIAENILDRWFTPSFIVENGGVVETVRTELLAISPSGYAGCCAAIRDMDMRATSRLIYVPVLVIGGDRDPATPPDHARFLADAIDGAELTMLDAAHLSNIERSIPFTQMVLEFCRAA
jgi:3-oxoadipate enol-lactonase